MRKTFLMLFVCGAVILASCSQATATPQQNAGSTPAVQTTAQATPAGEGAPQPTKEITASGPATCQPFRLLDKIIGAPDAKYPATSEKDWIEGGATAAITITEYSDFQCPYCGLMDPILAELMKKYPQDVRVVFRHFPLSIHDKSEISAQAAEAAGKQGQFNEMKAVLFNKQSEWSQMSVDSFKTWVKTEAKTLGLDETRFAEDLESKEIAEKIKAAEAEAMKLEIPGTPFLLINGGLLQADPQAEVLDAVVQLTRFKKNQFSECPPTTVDPKKKYSAVIKTEKGDITLDLFADKAPVTVNSFIFLARKGWYDGMTFHRVLPGFVAQTGDPSGTGFGSPGYIFGSEITTDMRFDKAGVVGMANSGPDTNGSQFFITYNEVSQLDGGYTIFGQVTSGLEVLNSLTPRDPSELGELAPGDKITTITIEEK